MSNIDQSNREILRKQAEAETRERALAERKEGDRVARLVLKRRAFPSWCVASGAKRVGSNKWRVNLSEANGPDLHIRESYYVVIDGDRIVSSEPAIPDPDRRDRLTYGDL